MRSFSDCRDPVLRPHSFGYDESITSDNRDALTFEMEPPDIGPGQVKFVLWAINDTDADAVLIVSGFGLQPTHLQGPRYVGPTLSPPAPPLHLRIQLPPRSRVAFERAFSAERWAFNGEPFDFSWFLQDHQSRAIAHGVVSDVRVGPPPSHEKSPT